MKKCSSCKSDKESAEFYTTSSRCKACVKDAAAAWYLANKSHAIARIGAYQKSNRAKCNQWSRDYYYRDVEGRRSASNEWARANPEKRRISRENWNNENRGRIAKVASTWSKKNREKCAAYWAKYHAAKLQAIPKWANQFFITEIYDLAKRRSALKSGGHSVWHVDHVVPLISKVVCGLHVEHNLRVIPGSLNMSKSNRYWPDMP